MFKLLIILAILLRLALMPISAHSDLFFINMFPNVLLTEKVFDIATFVQKNFESRNYTYYSPLTYYTFGFFQWLYHFVSPSFSSWMSQLYALEQNGFDGQAAGFIKATQNPHIFKDLFLAKIPYLLFDAASVYMLFKFVKEKFIKKSVILLWLFNPINLYGTYLMGQFDIIPTFFVIAGFYYLRKNLTIGLLLLGIAAAYKNFAILFIVPVAIIFGDTWMKRLKLFLIGVSPYSLLLVPTIISSYQQALYMILPKTYLYYRKPLEDWPLYSQSIKYILLVSSYLVVLSMSFLLKIKDKWFFAVTASLVSILLVFALAPRISFHYLLWATPLIFLWSKKTKLATTIIVIQSINLASYKLLANHLQLGLFAPLNPSYFASLPTLNSIIDRVIPYGLISLTGYFIFLLLNLFLISRILVNLLFKSQIVRPNSR